MVLLQKRTYTRKAHNARIKLAWLHLLFQLPKIPEDGETGVGGKGETCFVQILWMGQQQIQN